MRNPDLNAVIGQLVAEQVEKTLEPYRSLLDRMAAFVSMEAPRRKPGPRPAPAARPTRRGRRAKVGRRRGAARAAGDISRFHEGQIVRYRQGRGEFEAKVVGLDTERNVVLLRRTSDDKPVERPANKLYEVA